MAEPERVKKDLVSNAYPVCFVASIIHNKPRGSQGQRVSDETYLFVVSIQYVRGASENFKIVGGGYIRTLFKHRICFAK